MSIQKLPNFTDALRHNEEGAARFAGTTPSPANLDGRNITPSTELDAAKRTAQAIDRARINEPKSEAPSILSTDREETIESIVKEFNLGPSSQKDIAEAFDKMKAFQKAEDSSFPFAIESKNFGIIMPSSSKGYIFVQEETAEGSNKKFYKLIEVTEITEGKHRVNSKAGYFITDPEKFKNQGFRIDPFNFESRFTMQKSEFKWEMDELIFFVKDLYDGDIFQLAKKHNWDLGKRFDVMIECCKALEEAHAHGFVIRDVKLDNFLMKGEQVAIGDEDTVVSRNENVPPSRMLKNLYFDRRNNPSSGTDMYAFAWCLVKMFEKELPDFYNFWFQRNIERNHPKLAELLKNCSKKQRLLIKLVLDLCSRDIKERPSAKTTAKCLAAIKEIEGDAIEFADRNRFNLDKRLDLALQSCQALQHAPGSAEASPQNFYIVRGHVFFGDEDAIIQNEKSALTVKLKKLQSEKDNNLGAYLEGMFKYHLSNFLEMERYWEQKDIDNFRRLLLQSPKKQRMLIKLIWELHKGVVPERPSLQSTLERLAAIRKIDGDVIELAIKNDWSFAKRLEVMIQCCEALIKASANQAPIPDVAPESFYMVNGQVIFGDEDEIGQEESIDRNGDASQPVNAENFCWCLFKMFEKHFPDFYDLKGLDDNILKVILNKKPFKERKLLELILSHDEKMPIEDVLLQLYLLRKDVSLQ